MSLLQRPAGRWLLLGSLALNIALLVAFALLHAGWHGRHWFGGGPRMLGGFLLRGVVEPERRPTLEAILQQHRPEVADAARDAALARRQLDQVLRSEPFDPDALDATLRELRAHDQQTMRAVHAMMADAIRAMTPAERARLAERMHRHNVRRERRRGVEPPAPADRPPPPG